MSLERGIPARARLLTKDEELGKRDDDFTPARSRSACISTILPWRWRKRRLFAGIALIAVIYLFIQNLPTDLAEINRQAGLQSGRYTPDGTRDTRYTAAYDPYKSVAHEEPSGPPPRDKSIEDASDKHYYNGIVRYYKLAVSLHKISRTMGSLAQNRNILFAASSTKSLANLVPMACEMARADRSHAHVALFGRSTIPMDDILSINGIDEEDCPVYWHDARSDYAEYSSDARVEASVKGAMKHIQDFMHPQAIIVDSARQEDAYFSRAIKTAAKNIGKALIEIPSGRYEQFMWLTRLDAASLSAWHIPSIEILIHAPNDRSGRLIRLLQSLYNADYNGLHIPRLTIELPSKVEHFLGNYLAGFNWPPGRTFEESSQLTLRHRIPSSRTSSEQASIRFVESFYPSNGQQSHVLVLSPQAEVSPLYLQYLHYLILEYHHTAWGSPGSEDLLGFSLDVPSLFLDGKPGFVPPTIANMTYSKYDDTVDSDAPSPFLYQAASSTASLIIGDKWLEFHDFLAKRTPASHSQKTGKKTRKLASEAEPAWIEYLLELMRARGWTMLHPAASFVTIHNELAQVPEEYARPPADDKEATEAFKKSELPEEEPYVLNAEPPVPAEHVEADPTRHLQPLHQMLPFNGELQDVTQLPCVGHGGELITFEELAERTQKYKPEFRASIGGCKAAEASRQRVAPMKRTDDLFCLPGLDVRYLDDEEDVAAHVAEAIADMTDTDE
ncbi:hypothetical protein CLAFUW4_12055 [Fulvia fulva]|uniref:Uncharacterized protein n=1 Tax=Passalora fulva TaxID=5499 RepID=A0A9Q8PEM3_PASFU|nr:uncharacterized protein CLAFUR5_11094 [Fulvia fulva]KAK4617768.1 hypothetical protein CLAFUR4_12060 [Fulvia fulva]KAK4618701.1 hypothetical protein CLAFUR0_12071 [Fulvia fulva]UJO21179.1 hypothetical protein CLAFUR5_11094 [Fulvia fulva]WPV18683.1 hypothetical protein CLAFUW4_12055 [Fulvia fulva]WPV33504.1 hypothetical protein CLAFUW7_12062 [Fulvia fulva]